jgi:sugar lactone lactonase YvrE
LLVVSMTDRKVLRLEPGGLFEHADLSPLATFHGNDMVVDAAGRAYVGNFGFDIDELLVTQGLPALFAEPGPPTATLIRVDPDGSVHRAADEMRFPNGSVITPDGRTLIVAETVGHRLAAFDIAADGALSNRRVWADLGRRLPDGICLDAEGRVWVADPTSPECVLVAEGGEVVGVVEADQLCFACMLGGPEGRTLFVLTAATSIRDITVTQRASQVMVASVDVPHAGLP